MSVFLKPVERSEASIEKADCAWLKKQGFDPQKFTSPGSRSRPDRIVFDRNGLCFFIEFKRPGKDATPMQHEDHEQRRARGFICEVSHGREETIRIVEKFTGMSVSARLAD